MNIGTLAKQANVNIQTVRYYERIGILKAVQRRDSGYRIYDADSLKRLLFIKRAQDLGFALNDIRELLNLRASTPAARERVRAKAREKISEIRSKITELKKLESNLKKLVRDCEHGSLKSPCPILERMEVSSP
ncbi:MAG: heavy metal-responsive transcriptional regulator [Deltaproteobacteria bacterium]|nr:heavy metal-responsive transcriptional regulator [Deltaproteobacteria bacterium]